MENGSNPTLVVYGAGNIGRGIISLLFQNAGYHLLFYRRDSRALREMKARGGYRVRIQGTGAEQDTEIKNFDILEDEQALIRALSSHSLAVCALYPSAFPEVAKTLAEVCRIRSERNDPKSLNLLLCCNEPGGAQLLRSLLEKALKQNGCLGLECLIGIVPVLVYSVGFHTPDGGPYDMTVSENGRLDAERDSFLGTPGRIPGLCWVEGVDRKLYRKLYLGNMFHTFAALLGAEKGYSRISQCYEDQNIRQLARQAFVQSETAVLKQWQFDREEHARWRVMMLAKMDVPSADDVERVLKDLPRKLRKEDRLVGPALLCIQQGCPCDCLVYAVALALGRLGEQKPEVQGALAQDAAGTIAALCGLDKEEPAQRRLIQRIVQRLQK